MAASDWVRTVELGHAMTAIADTLTLADVAVRDLKGDVDIHIMSLASSRH
jgi:hypothetical protein